MFATFNFGCEKGHEFEELVDKAETETRCPKCGARAIRLFTVTQSISVPYRMKAVNDNELVKHQAFYKSKRHRAMREQDERISARSEAVLNGMDRHFHEAANSTKLQKAYHDMKHAEVTAKPKKKR